MVQSFFQPEAKTERAPYCQCDKSIFAHWGWDKDALTGGPSWDGMCDGFKFKEYRMRRA